MNTNFSNDEIAVKALLKRLDAPGDDLPTVLSSPVLYRLYRNCSTRAESAGSDYSSQRMFSPILCEVGLCELIFVPGRKN